MAHSGARRARDPELARAAATQKAQEQALQSDLIREQRTEKKARIKKDLFEEEEVKQKPTKPKKQATDGAEKKSAADDRPSDALREVDGEEAAPADEFDEKGVPIEPFNLKAEREEGYFDKDGNYVRKRGDSPVRDAWLDEVDEQLTSKGKTKALSKARVEEKPSGAEVPFDLNRTKRVILRLLQLNSKQETTLTALRRLKAEGRMVDFNALTEAADLCVQNGVYEIYSETVRQLLASLGADEGEAKVWEYRAPGGGEEVHGPFSTSQMSEWHSAGYFQGDTVMLVRRVGSPTFRRSDELDFDRLLMPKQTTRDSQGT